MNITEVSEVAASLLGSGLPEPSRIELTPSGWVSSRPIEFHMTDRAAVAQWAHQVGVQVTIDPRHMFVEAAALFEVKDLQVKVWSSETHAGLFQVLSRHGLALDDDQPTTVDPSIFLSEAQR